MQPRGVLWPESFSSKPAAALNCMGRAQLVAAGRGVLLVDCNYNNNSRDQHENRYAHRNRNGSPRLLAPHEWPRAPGHHLSNRTNPSAATRSLCIPSLASNWHIRSGPLLPCTPSSRSGPIGAYQSALRRAPLFNRALRWCDCARNPPARPRAQTAAAPWC